jgi:carbonic anhydrase
MSYTHPEIQFLIDGYHIFKKNYFSPECLLYNELAQKGQNPKIMMVACCDSRVDPAIVLHTRPGDLFMVRNVANLIPPYEQDSTYYHGTSAALEFGICGLDIRHVIICGHSQCGGIRALLKGSTQDASDNSFIHKWMQLAQPAHDFVLENHADLPLEEQVTICAQQSLVHSLDHLKTFPWVQERIQAETLFLHAWYFDVCQGTIQEFNEKQAAFVML